MDYEFFESLTIEQAKQYLDRFLEVEREAFNSLMSQATSDGVVLDFSMPSLSPAMKWIIKEVRFRHVPLADDEPAWIRQAHRHGVLEFDDASKTTILRAGYYFGSCFARRPGMCWTTGDLEYMHANMPVVAGFDGGDELAPLVVIDNIFARILGRGAPLTTIDTTIDFWNRLCPHHGK